MTNNNVFCNSLWMTHNIMYIIHRTADCLTSGANPINGMKFTTHDVDNDRDNNYNCAEKYKGGWWFRKCHCANLNGLYLAGHHNSYADGVNWANHSESLKRAIMMIRKV